MNSLSEHNDLEAIYIKYELDIQGVGINSRALASCLSKLDYECKQPINYLMN